MDAVLWVCGGIGAAGMVLALIFLPSRLATAAKRAAPAPEIVRARRTRRGPSAAA